MKKLLALLLAGVMVMGLSTTAMAATKHFSSEASLPGVTLEDDKTLPFEDSSEVFIDVNPNTAAAVYYVTVEWDSLTFAYDFGTAPVWDPIEHSYTDAGAPGWQNRVANIVVTNHSNRNMEATASFEKTSSVLTKTVNDVSATLNCATGNLATGEGLKFSNASSTTFTVTIGEGDVPNTTEDFSLGTVYLTISEDI